ncbi:alpha/beta fold hydrolase [Massilia sp. SR12]
MTAPKGVREVTYQSGKLQLKAWITASNKGTKLVPAVVFLHGGFAFSQEDWDAAGSLIDAGYILMMPRLRGENGNPGNFEFFGGEVDDAIAAGRYLAAIPGVDKDRIFLIGHSVGASLAILVAQMESPYKASAALSGYPRLLEWIDHYNQIAPFDARNELERKIRNPYLYTESVRIPLYLFSESQNQYVKSTNAEFCLMVAKASLCRHEIVGGDHSSMIAPSLSRAISIFRAADRESK